MTVVLITPTPGVGFPGEDLVHAAPAGQEPEPEDPVAAALKSHLLSMLAEPLTVRQARKIARFAAQASKTLAHVSPSMADALEKTRQRRPKQPGYAPYGMQQAEDPDGLDLDEEGADDSITPLPLYGGFVGPENVGNTFMREIVAALPKLTEFFKAKGTKTETTADLVDAITTARANDMPELEAELSAALHAKIGVPNKSTPADLVARGEQLGVVSIPTANGGAP